ncbi:hypothetical protein HanRHA438_Chr08g0349331 [Helianthus annuus]|nr:hypothetical protein HanRHA438_Chr08g0349331 [Helianthus annuus]
MEWRAKKMTTSSFSQVSKTSFSQRPCKKDDKFIHTLYPEEGSSTNVKCPDDGEQTPCSNLTRSALRRYKFDPNSFQINTQLGQPTHFGSCASAYSIFEGN